MKFYVMTDLEGVVGTDSFTQTRTQDCGPTGKGPSMKQLAREVNACVRGIRRQVPDAQIEVYDGHGSGGLFPEEIEDATVVSREGRSYEDLSGYDALLYVGQHAMAGTVDAPLNHTYSSLNVAYYRLNGTFIGEFGMLALRVGLQGVPTIFLAGDDKAALEAQMFVPAIRTVVTKYGLGIEKALHRDPRTVLAEIEERTADAVVHRTEIAPFTSIAPPFVLECRHYRPLTGEILAGLPEHTLIDERTYQITAETFSGLTRRRA